MNIFNKIKNFLGINSNNSNRTTDGDYAMPVKESLTSFDVNVTPAIPLDFKSKRKSTVDNTYRKIRYTLYKEGFSKEDLEKIKENKFALFPENDINYTFDEKIIAKTPQSVAWGADYYDLEEKEDHFLFVIDLTFNISFDLLITKDNKLGASPENDFGFYIVLDI